MKFCQHNWSVKFYRADDRSGKPTGQKVIYCDLPVGHLGDHRNGSRTDFNYAAAQRKKVKS